MIQDEVLTALDKAGLGHYREQVKALLQPAIALQTVPAADQDLPVGASKVGGWPDLPPETPWPHWKGRYGTWETPRPLHFLAQINLRDTKATLPDTPLPPSGLLSVFYDADEQPWGMDGDEDGFKMLYTPADASLERCAVPSALRALADLPDCFHPCALRFSLMASLRSVWDLKVSDGESKAFERFLDSTDAAQSGYGGKHQMLGLADYVQGEVPFDLALEEMSLSYQSVQGEDADSPLRGEIAERASKWLLLLQIDSDDEAKNKPGWMWGDAGMLYFHIHEEDLAARDFSRVRMVLQCH